jgi:peroxiredoxin
MKSLAFLFVSLALVSSRPEGGYDVGDVVTDFKLKNVDGKMVSLSDYKTAKGFIIIFDCNTCPVSKAYTSRIIDLNKKFASQGYPVVVINPNSPEVVKEESFNDMIKQAKNHKYDFPYLYDESQETVKQFFPTNTPHVFILNKVSDQLKVVYIGGIDNNSRDASKADKHFVEDAIGDLMAGRTVATPKAKTVGCSIKWKNS